MLDTLQINPIAFTIPIGENGFPVYWYGILVTLGIAIGVWWASREIERRKQNVDEFFNGLILVIATGYLFARLTYVMLDVISGRGALYQNIVDVINIRQGGVNILGGFIGATLVAIWFARWRRLKLWHYADVAGPALLIAQAIGRWGNFINQELYGPPTTLPWGIHIDPAYRLTQYADLTTYPAETLFHPTFLYESLWLLVGFVVLVGLNSRYREQWRPGTVFGMFLVWWGVGRTWIEFFRPDQVTIGNSVITYSMITAVLLATVGVLLLLNRYNRLPLNALLSPRRRRRKMKPRPQRQ